jgi:hypothetical protein
MKNGGYAVPLYKPEVRGFGFRLSLEFLIYIILSVALCLGLTQSLTEMSTRNISCGVQAAGA